MQKVFICGFAWLLLGMTRAGVEVDVNGPPPPPPPPGYYYDPYYDGYWYGPGWYWGIYIGNEDDYWRNYGYHHHWHGQGGHHGDHHHGGHHHGGGHGGGHHH